MPKTQLISSPAHRLIVPLFFTISSLSDVKYRLRIYTKSNAGILSDNGVKPFRSTNKTARLRITPGPFCFNLLFSAFLSLGGLIRRLIITVPPLLNRVAHPSRMLSHHFSRSAILNSSGDLGSSSSRPSITSTLQVLQMALPPHADTISISASDAISSKVFLDDATGCLIVRNPK